MSSTIVPHRRRARDLIDRSFAEQLDLDALAAGQRPRVPLRAVVRRPADRPYGVEAIFRNDSGNWIVLVERREYTGEEFPHN